MVDINQLTEQAQYYYAIMYQKDEELKKLKVQEAEAIHSCQGWKDYCDKLEHQYRRMVEEIQSPQKLRDIKRLIESKLIELQRRKTVFLTSSTEDPHERENRAKAILYAYYEDAQNIQKEKEEVEDQIKAALNEISSIKKDLAPILTDASENISKALSDNRQKKEELYDLKINSHTKHLKMTGDYFNERQKTYEVQLQSLIGKSKMIFLQEQLASINKRKDLASNINVDLDMLNKNVFNLPDDIEAKIEKKEKNITKLKDDIKGTMDRINFLLNGLDELRPVTQEFNEYNDSLKHDIFILRFKEGKTSSEKNRLMQMNKYNRENKLAQLEEELKGVEDDIINKHQQINELKKYQELDKTKRKNATQADMSDQDVQKINTEVTAVQKQRDTLLMNLLTTISAFSNKYNKNRDLLLTKDSQIGTSYLKLQELSESIKSVHDQTLFFENGIGILMNQIAAANYYINNKLVNDKTPIFNPGIFTCLITEFHNKDQTSIANQIIELDPVLDIYDFRFEGEGLQFIHGSPASMTNALFHPDNKDPLYPTMLAIELLFHSEDNDAHFQSIYQFAMDVVEGKRNEDYTPLDPRKYICSKYPNYFYPEVNKETVCNQFINYIEKWLLFNPNIFKVLTSTLAISVFLKNISQFENRAIILGNLLTNPTKILHSDSFALSVTQTVLRKKIYDTITTAITPDIYVEHMNYNFQQHYIGFTLGDIIKYSAQSQKPPSFQTIEKFANNIQWHVISTFCYNVTAKTRIPTNHKEKEKAIEWWLKAAELAWKQKNFQLFVSIMKGLTIKELKEEIRKILKGKNDLGSQFNDFKEKAKNEYEEKRPFNEYHKRSDLRSVEGFVIPCFQFYFTFYEDFLKTEKVNKRKQAEFFEEMFKGQLVRINYKIDPDLASELMTSIPICTNKDNIPKDLLK